MRRPIILPVIYWESFLRKKFINDISLFPRFELVNDMSDHMWIQLIVLSIHEGGN
jgi:hypothetical protein